MSEEAQQGVRIGGETQRELRMGKRKRGNLEPMDSGRWSDRELWDFVMALQQYGSADTKNIALAVRTKSEKAVKSFIAREVAKRRVGKVRGGGKPARIMSPALQWLKIAQNQMMNCVKKVDYSRLIMPKLCDQFLRECSLNPPSSSQVVNVGALYRHMQAYLSGSLPAELPPKESALLLMMLRLIREMLEEMDMSEETSFVRGFRKSTTFVPCNVKDDFRKKAKKGESSKAAEKSGYAKNTVPIPEQVFSVLSRHRKVVQSFNPLTVPIWIIEKQEKFLEQMFR